MSAPTMPTQKKRAPTKAELQRTIDEIEEFVARAEEIIAMDHHRPALANGIGSPNWYAGDFGALQYNVERMRETLNDLRDRS